MSGCRYHVIHIDHFQGSSAFLQQIFQVPQGGHNRMVHKHRFLEIKGYVFGFGFFNGFQDVAFYPKIIRENGRSADLDVRSIRRWNSGDIRFKSVEDRGPVIEMDGQLGYNPTGHSDQQVGAKHRNHGKGKQEQLFLADFHDMHELPGRSQLETDGYQNSGKGGAGNHIDHRFADQKENQQESAVPEVGPLCLCSTGYVCGATYDFGDHGYAADG